MFGLVNRDQLPTSTLDEFEHFTSALKAWALKEHNEDGSHFTSATTNIPVGGIISYGGSTAPSTSWLMCDGGAYSRVTYQPLFNIIGTTYGIGDGATTFNVPNLQQRLPLGKAAAGTGSTLGSTGGAIDHTHGTSGMTAAAGTTGSESSHTHTQGDTTGVVGSFKNVDQNLDGIFVTVTGDHEHTNPATSAGSAHAHSIPAAAISGTLDTNNPPYLVVNFIILAN